MNNEKLNEMAEELAIAYAESERGRKSLTVNEMFFFKAGFQSALSLPEVKAMREALEFYANENYWGILGDFDISLEGFDLGDDMGFRARKALADIGEVMK